MSEPKKILIIDDEQLFCELLVNRLRFEGFFVDDFATNLETGLSKIEERKHDIVLIDLNSSDNLKSSINNINEMLRVHPLISIIVLHDNKNNNADVLEIVDRVMRAGCKGFVIKQDCYGDLKSAITKVSAGKVYIASSLQDEVTERFFTQTDSHMMNELYSLRESVDKYQQIFKVTDIILYKLDKRGIFTEISDSVSNITNYTADEIIGEPYHRFIHKEDMENILQNYIYPFKNIERKVTEVRLVDKNRDILYMTTANNMLENETIVGVLINMTSQKKVQLELENSQKRVRAMIENSTDVIQITDIKGNITYISPSIEKNFGYIENDLIGRNMLDNIFPDDHALFLKGIEKITGNNGKIVSSIYRYRHKNGTWSTVESTLKNCLDDPSILGIMNNFSDITDRKEAEKKLLDVMLKQLTGREVECLNHYLEGYDKRDISIMMDVERETVDRYLKRILEKMGKDNIDELIEVLKKPYDISKK